MSAAAVRRGIRLSVAAAVVAAGAVHVGLAPAASAADASISRVGYTCKATNSIINTSLDGPQQFYVTAQTSLPESVEPGSTVPATNAKLTLFLPPKLVNRLMEAMSVERVKGSATSDVVLQAVAPGGELVKEQHEPVNNLKVDQWVTLVKDSEIAIEANGTVNAVAVPDADEDNGLIYVQMPNSFVLHSEMDPPVLKQIDKADLNCVRDENSAASRVIGTIKVGNGCTEQECPLPATIGGSGGGGTDSGGDDGVTTGSGSDPVIDPAAPVATSTVDNGVDDLDAEDSDDQDVAAASYTTTELPATGSTLGLGVLGLFGVAVVARIALAVRSRRRDA